MNYRVYEPTGEVQSEQVGLLYVNQVGSSLRHDAGRDAQYLADHFGLQVIAINRPGTGDYTYTNPVLARQITTDYPKAMSTLAGEVSAEADRLGLQNLVANGRSAGALGALALTRTEKLPIEHVYGAETIGVRNFDTPRTGHRAYVRYLKKQNMMLKPGSPDLIRPEPSDVSGLEAWKCKFAAMPLLFLTDMYHSEGAWLNGEALPLVRDIATDMPHVDVTLEFAEFSMALDNPHEPPKSPDVSGPVIIYARRREADQAPFVVRRVANTVHSSFDNRSFYASRLAPVVSRAIEQSGE